METSIEQQSGYLETDTQHRIFFRQIGNPEGKPLAFLHGGPGASCQPETAHYFDLDKHQVIQIDQRGCGYSTPSGNLHHNKTQNLINDMEHIRTRLGYQKWSVYGGSWGATLALEYAKQHRQHIEQIILRGSFLARDEDLSWFISPDGVATMFPDDYNALTHALAPQQGENLINALYRHLVIDFTYPIQAKSLPDNAYHIALAWDTWEAKVMGMPAPAIETDTNERYQRVLRKRIYAHYCQHHFFLGENGVLDQIELLTELPIHIVHGRKDLVCQHTGARLLHSHLSRSTLQEVNAGHMMHETPIKGAIQAVIRYHF